MPTLADCINDLFSPLNTTASSGSTPVKPAVGSFLDPDSYDPATVTYSLDNSKFYNSFYFLMGFV